MWHDTKEIVSEPRTVPRCFSLYYTLILAQRDFIYFLRTSSVGVGGGGMLPDFFFCSLFPVQQTTSGIGHRVK